MSEVIEKKYVLAINPGSTSTKIAVFENLEPQFVQNIAHHKKDLEKFKNINDQYEYRKKTILKTLLDKKFDITMLSAVVARGGLMKPIEGGVYTINQRMVDDLMAGVSGKHASNLAAVIAYGISWDLNLPSFVVDPPVIDEFTPLAKLTGMPEIKRRSMLHALNIRAVARRESEKMARNFDDVNLIVAHLGGGVSIAALERGKIVDGTNALYEGPLTPERAGALPTGDLMELIFSGKYKTKEELYAKLVGKSGFNAYLNTNSAKEVGELYAQNNPTARLVFDGMAYQVAKFIAEMAAVLKGKVDAIIITGGMAFSKGLTDLIAERVSFISKVILHPGEDEMRALAEGCLRVLNGAETPKVYR
jgi:butyrate kinase